MTYDTSILQKILVDLLIKDGSIEDTCICICFYSKMNSVSSVVKTFLQKRENVGNEKNVYKNVQFKL